MSEILKEHPLKLMMAAYLSAPRNSAQEAIAAAAVDMMIKLPTRKALTTDSLRRAHLDDASRQDSA